MDNPAGWIIALALFFTVAKLIADKAKAEIAAKHVTSDLEWERIEKEWREISRKEWED